MRIRDWTAFKNFVDARNISVQWLDLNGHYFLKAIDGEFELSLILRKETPASSNQTDFETNYQTKGNKKVDIPKRFEVEVAKGDKPGDSSVNKFGTNLDTGTSFEIVWNHGGDYVYPSTAAVISISSSSADDASAGTGAREMVVSGLDENYAPIEETMNPNGTSSVTSTAKFLRVFRAKISQAGTKGKNVGDITVLQNGNTVGLVNAGVNQTLMALYTIPAGKTGYLKSYYYSIPKSKEVETRLLVRPLNQVFQTKHLLYVQEQYLNHEFGFPILLEEKSDIQLVAKSLSGTNHSVAAGFDILLVDNND